MIERLKQEMERLGINARELSSRANVGRSFVYDLLSGRSANPTTKKMEAIASALGVSLPSLISGTSNDNSAVTSAQNFIALPFLVPEHNPANAVCNNYLLNKNWISTYLQTSPENLRVVVINDDSMYPNINRFDSVLVDISCKTPEKPGIFILKSGTMTIARRVEFSSKSKKEMLILPDNKHYIPHTCDITDIEIAGRVVWVARQLP